MTDSIRGLRASRWWLVLGVTAVLAACEPGPGSEGTADSGAGGTDAARTDGGADAAPTDAAPTDAGVSADATASDADVTTDGAIPPDGGRPGPATQLRAVRLNWTQGPAGRGTQRFEMTGGGLRLTGGRTSP